MQRLLYRAVWDADAVRDDGRALVVQSLGDPDGVLVPDETGDLKKGTHTVGVQRQYTSTAGRIENAQVAVFMTYAGRRGHTLVDRRLYLPVFWSGDPGRMGLRVSEQIGFATRSKLAADMITAAVDAQVPARWVAADEAYGNSSTFRCRLRELRRSVLAVSCDHLVPLDGGKTRRRADHIAAALPATAWQRRSAGAGSKGPRLYDWVWLDEVTTDADCGDGWHSILIRRNRRAGPRTTWSPAASGRRRRRHARRPATAMSPYGRRDHDQPVPAAGLIDELRLHIVPLTLGAGTRLFEGVPPLRLEQVTARAASTVTHDPPRAHPSRSFSHVVTRGRWLSRRSTTVAGRSPAGTGRGRSRRRRVGRGWWCRAW
jgi:hypothetical protein